MAPTSNTRCEVAEELRGLVSEHSAVQCDAVAHVLGLKYEVHGCIAAFSREDVTALSDLIDPTCHIDVMSTGNQADYECREHIMHCKSCGAEFGYVLYGEDGDVSMDDKPSYCPNCGARVVDEDGD